MTSPQTAQSEECERLSVLAQNVDADRAKAEAQRDVLQERLVDLAKRLSALVGPMAKAQDAIRAHMHTLGNAIQGLDARYVTKDELDEREVRIIKLARGIEE
jgi:hypothetical protein